MHRNRKTAAILVVATALVVALIFAVGHSRAATDNGSHDKATATTPNGGSPNADGGTGTNLAVKLGKESGASHSSGASGQGTNSSNGSGGPGTTTPPTTTPPGGGTRPPFRFPIDQVGNLGLDKNPGTPPTTTPPNHNTGGGTGCVHKQGFACP